MTSQDKVDREIAGYIGEIDVRNELRHLKEIGLIKGFIRSKNIIYFGNNFQIDFLILVPKIGLLIIEVKNWKGEIRTNFEKQWIQVNGNHKNIQRNAALQVLRTAGLLLQVLEREKCNKWPIRPLVVFADNEAKVMQLQGEKAPQTDVIRLRKLKDWISTNSSQEIAYQFTRNDFENIKMAICKYTEEYQEFS